MKQIVFFFILSFSCKLYSQQLDIQCIFQNDSSYLKLHTNNIAEFKIHKKLYQDTAEYRVHKKLQQDTVQFFKRLQQYYHYEGKGSFYIKDSIIYINTTGDNKKSYPTFEDIGQSKFDGKLSIEVFDQNSNIFSTFYIYVKGKESKRYEKSDNNTCEVDLNKIKKPVSIRIYPYNNSVQRCFFSFEIPVKSIKTNKIRVYLTNILLVKDKLMKFQLKKDGHNVFVVGPKDISKEDKRRIIKDIYPCYNMSILLYAVKPPVRHSESIPIEQRSLAPNMNLNALECVR
jgi:hypothetical protein